MKNNNYVRRLPLAALASLMTLALTSCAPANSDPEENDPMESINRGVHEFNMVVDNFVFEPVAKGYRYITPDGVRSRIGNISDNLVEPLTMVNAFLQGDFQHGMTSFWRFLLNSTIGIAGMNDVAGSAGLERRPEDFGQTMAVWGAGEGPYIVLPFFGPSNLRDTGGKVADWFIDPMHYAIDDTSTEIWISGGRALVQRERLINVLDDVEETSLDTYVTLRSMYRQHRAALVANTGEGPLPTSGNEAAE